MKRFFIQFIFVFLFAFNAFGSSLQVGDGLKVSGGGLFDLTNPPLRASILEWLYEGDGIVPRIAEDYTAVFTRASTDWCEDVSGVLQSVAVDIPCFEYIAGTYVGYSQEPQRQNIALYSQEFNQGGTWAATNVTVATNSIAAPDAATTAETLTATAGNATVLQAITSAQADRVFSLYIKRKTGTGNIDLTVDNGGSWATVVVTSSWVRHTITQAIVTDPTIGIRIVTDTDAIYVWQSDCEIGSAETSIIPTTIAAVTRAVDDLQLPVADGVNFRNSAGMLFAGVTFGLGDAHPASAAALIALRTSSFSILRWHTTDGIISSWDGANQVSYDGGSFVAGTTYETYVRWTASSATFQIGYDGSSGSAATYDGAFTLGTHFHIGYGATERFWLKDVRILRVDRGTSYGESQTADIWNPSWYERLAVADDYFDVALAQ